MADLITRKLGRTDRQVSTLGLGGQASIQWTGPGIDPVAIIQKAYDLGITYMDTSNLYGPSQQNFGEAFHRLGLSAGARNYNASAREKIFVASKTHFRTARSPEGQRFRSDFSQGMQDGFEVTTAVDDVRRSLSQMFGDGRGAYPEGSYLDSIQFHNINTMEEVDMLFEGLDDPNPNSDWMGALAAMLDLREGTNRTGCNPKKEKLVKHIGITGHWNTAAHVYAIQRDTRRILDTLLVSINASDNRYMAHRHNAIAAAAAADMGIIGMKVFADAAYYHKDVRFSSNPADVYHDVGSRQLPSSDLIQYALSVAGIHTLIVGIGHIDDAPEKCQLSQNIAAAQLSTPLSEEAMQLIEERVVSAGKDSANAYFQRKAMGLTPPRNVGVEIDSAMPGYSRNAVRVSWDSAYAGAQAIDRYDVLRDGAVIGSVPHAPQITPRRFYFDDVFGPDTVGAHDYAVRAVDTSGNCADSIAITPIEEKDS
jgi:aryl-alcohol dehydrogenase-like predicted oxidoreductase